MFSSVLRPMLFRPASVFIDGSPQRFVRFDQQRLLIESLLR
jgi:hypothetical protein